jgi:hypothetical protein
MPFVQGHLRNEPVAVTFRTACTHCARFLEIGIDSTLAYHVNVDGAAPLVFVPLVNFATLKAKSIIDDF